MASLSGMAEYSEIVCDRKHRPCASFDHEINGRL